MATRKGIIKRTELTAFSRPRAGGIIALGLDRDDELIGVGELHPPGDPGRGSHALTAPAQAWREGVVHVLRVRPDTEEKDEERGPPRLAAGGSLEWPDGCGHGFPGVWGDPIEAFLHLGPGVGDLPGLGPEDAIH